jgi:hypothetical protein
MSDLLVNRLKGAVRYGRTIPLGRFKVVEVEWFQEYYLDETTAEQLTYSLESRMKRALQEAGIVD